MNERINVGVVGCGYWGPNLIRNFHNLADCDLKVICDLDIQRLNHLKGLYPQVEVSTDFQELIARDDLHALVIATSAPTHYGMAKEALLAGKHVFIEKPMATSSTECDELVQLAAARGLTLMVGHTFLYSAPVRRIKEIITAGDIGELRYINARRLNLGLFQRNINVTWDLAPHDISIMLYLLEHPVRKVSAIGASHVDTNVENIAYLTLQFDTPMLAHFHVNWLAPAKVRRTIIGGSKKMLVYDDGEMDDKLRVYDSGAQLAASREAMYRTFVEYRTGDVLIPKLEKAEALAVEMKHFINVVRGFEAPISGGELGIEVVRVIEAAQRSLRMGGTAVEVER